MSNTEDPVLKKMTVVTRLAEGSPDYKLVKAIHALVLNYIHNSNNYPALTMQIRGCLGKKPDIMPLFLMATDTLKETMTRYISDHLHLTELTEVTEPLIVHVGEAIYNWLGDGATTDLEHVLPVSMALYSSVESFGRLCLSIYGLMGLTVVQGRLYVNTPYEMTCFVFDDDESVCIKSVTKVWELPMEIFVFTISPEENPKILKYIKGYLDLCQALMDNCPLLSTYLKHDHDAYQPSQQLLNDVKDFFCDHQPEWEERLGLPLKYIDPLRLIRHLNMNQNAMDNKNTVNAPMTIVPGDINEDGVQTFMLKIKGLDDHPTFEGYPGEYKPINMAYRAATEDDSEFIVITLVRTSDEDPESTPPSGNKFPRLVLV